MSIYDDLMDDKDRVLLDEAVRNGLHFAVIARGAVVVAIAYAPIWLDAICTDGMLYHWNGTWEKVIKHNLISVVDTLV